MVVKGLVLLGTVCLAGGLAWATNWLALIPWRRSAGRHWTERARVLFPVRAACGDNLLIIPVCLTITEYLSSEELFPPWPLTALAAAIGALAGALWMDHEIFPRISWPSLLRQATMSFVLRLAFWLSLVGAAALMPPEFDRDSLKIFCAVFLCWLFWSRAGFILTARCLRLAVQPPVALHDIVEQTAAGMRVRFRSVWLLRSSFAGAYALTGSRELLFTERLLEICPNDEVAAVCAHELGHLTESRMSHFRHYLGWLAILPWIFVKPLVNEFHSAAIGALALNSILVRRSLRAARRKLKPESRADAIAKSNESSPGVYARALARVYEDAALPAVVVGHHRTHPDLFDRMLAAGVAPDYPRPAPAERTAWSGAVWRVLLVVAIVALLTSEFGLTL